MKKNEMKKIKEIYKFKKLKTKEKTRKINNLVKSLKRLFQSKKKEELVFKAI